MAITVTVESSGVGINSQDNQNNLYLALSSDNTDRPGETVGISMSFPVTMTAAQIKANVNSAVSLLWQASSVSTWTV